MLFTYEIGLSSSVNRDDAVMRDVPNRVHVLGFLGLCHCLVSSISDAFAVYFFPRISHKFDWILTSLTKELLSFSLAGNINKSFDEWRPMIVNSSFNKKEELCALGPQSSLEYHNSALFYEMFTNQRWLSARFLISSPNRDCNQWDMSSIIDYDIERSSPGIKKRNGAGRHPWLEKIVWDQWIVLSRFSLKLWLYQMSTKSRVHIEHVCRSYIVDLNRICIIDTI